MQRINESLLEVAGELATASPSAWIYSWAAAGTVIAMAIYGFAGWCLGTLVGHGIAGAYTGCAYYAFWFAQNVETLKGNCQAQIQLLEELIKETQAR